MKEEYINHLAIEKNMSSEAYKESYMDNISSEDVTNDAKKYFILRQISQTCEFVIKENTEKKTFKSPKQKPIRRNNEFVPIVIEQVGRTERAYDIIRVC